MQGDAKDAASDNQNQVALANFETNSETIEQRTDRPHQKDERIILRAQQRVSKGRIVQQTQIARCVARHTLARGRDWRPVKITRDRRGRAARVERVQAPGIEMTVVGNGSKRRSIHIPQCKRNAAVSIHVRTKETRQCRRQRWATLAPSSTI